MQALWPGSRTARCRRPCPNLGPRRLLQGHLVRPGLASGGRPACFLFPGRPLHDPSSKPADLGLGAGRGFGSAEGGGGGLCRAAGGLARAVAGLHQRLPGLGLGHRDRPCFLSEQSERGGDGQPPCQRRPGERADGWDPRTDGSGAGVGCWDSWSRGPALAWPVEEQEEGVEGGDDSGTPGQRCQVTQGGLSPVTVRGPWFLGLPDCSGRWQQGDTGGGLEAWLGSWALRNGVPPARETRGAASRPGPAGAAWEQKSALGGT